MAGTLVAFAGISTLCEEVLLAGLRSRPDIELLPRWTELPLIAGKRNHGGIEVLFVELADDHLPAGLLVLLAAAEPLRIVGMTPDANRATLFTVHERRILMIGANADQLFKGAGQD